MKLYDCPKGSKIRLVGDVTIPVAHPPLDEGDVLTFDHIDGMYSLCYTLDGAPVHPVVWSDVEIVETEADNA